MERPLTIGWKEYVAFPEWGIRRLKVKADTGARTSALGVDGYQLVEQDGRAMVEMRIPRRRRGCLTVRVPLLRTVRVRNSNGVEEDRPLIEASVVLGPVVKRVPLTLTDRSRMRFPMILGRKALEGDFVVDVSRKYVLKKSVSGEW